MHHIMMLFCENRLYLGLYTRLGDRIWRPVTGVFNFFSAFSSDIFPSLKMRLRHVRPRHRVIGKSHLRTLTHLFSSPIELLFPTELFHFQDGHSSTGRCNSHFVWELFQHELVNLRRKVLLKGVLRFALVIARP
jgi:hypothetical protein